jgi:ABC-type branched-subunit amino acid transport system substrate-binding protein
MNRKFLTAGLLALTSCAAPPPPAPVAAATAAPVVQMAQLLRQAEAQGYAEGLAAGKRIQARKDHEQATEAPAKPAPAVAEATPPHSPAPAPVPEPPVANSFAPQGPAVPLMSPNAGGI